MFSLEEDDEETQVENQQTIPTPSPSPSPSPAPTPLHSQPSNQQVGKKLEENCGSNIVQNQFQLDYQNYISQLKEQISNFSDEEQVDKRDSKNRLFDLLDTKLNIFGVPNIFRISIYLVSFIYVFSSFVL